MITQLNCDSCIQLEQHIYALLHALVKVYDNYKTPLGSHVTCWKVKYSNLDLMMVGMTVQKMNTQVEYIYYLVPLEKWDDFNIMEIPESPITEHNSSDKMIERLMGL